MNGLNIFTLIALTLLVCVMPACSKDDAIDMPDGDTPSRPMMSISIAMQGSRAASAIEGFEVGEGLENYLDIAHNSFRIYFFTSDNDIDPANWNRYIGTFSPIVKSGPETDVASVTSYSFWGEAPAELPKEFKIVAIFNWREYPVSGLTSEGTPVLKYGSDIISSIEDLCTHTSAQFQAIVLDAANDDWLDAHSPDRLIPFYGVRKYKLLDHIKAGDLTSDGELKGEAFVDLSRNTSDTDTSLPILRAMAKVEVILDNQLASFTEVAFSKVNSSGFCAPYRNSDDWAYDYTDYFNGYVYDKDFVRGVHLTYGATDQNKGEGTNDPDPKDDVVFKKVNDRTVTKGDDGKETVTPEKWVAYIPEYRNLGEGSSPTSIRVRLSVPKDEETSMTDTEYRYIYFSEEGRLDGSAFDVERNNIYRFTVSVNFSNGLMDVVADIQPFAEQKLNFQFGLIRDGRGDLMVPEIYELDEDGNTIITYPQYFIDFINDKNPKHKYPNAEDIDGNIITPEERIQLEDGDYYAIVVGENEDMADAVVWVKDRDECHVLSNFESTHVGDDQDCNARLVESFFGNNQSEKFYKDKFGYRRVHHFANHNSIVRHPRLDHLLFCMIANFGQPNQSQPQYYEVESWDETECTGWIILRDQETKEEIGFRKITSDGELGVSVNLDGSPKS